MIVKVNTDSKNTEKRKKTLNKRVKEKRDKKEKKKKSFPQPRDNRLCSPPCAYIFKYISPLKREEYF